MIVDHFRPHFMKQHYEFVIPKRKHKPIKNKLSSDFDKLFFHLLIILKYTIPLHYTKHEERQIKYIMSQSMESFKYKKKEDIIQNICYEDTITLKTLACLSTFHKLNLVYVYDNVYCKMLNGTINTPIYIVNHDKEFFHIYPEKLETIYEDKFEITDIQKPLYSVSHYKVPELQEILRILHLDQDVPKKKQDSYELIKSYLEMVLF